MRTEEHEDPHHFPLENVEILLVSVFLSFLCETSIVETPQLSAALEAKLNSQRCNTLFSRGVYLVIFVSGDVQPGWRWFVYSKIIIKMLSHIILMVA